MLEEFDRIIGIERLKALHLNDSKNPLGAHKDRHEKIGEGYIGINAFERVVNNKYLKNLPMFLERLDKIKIGFPASGRNRVGFYFGNQLEISKRNAKFYINAVNSTYRGYIPL